MVAVSHAILHANFDYGHFYFFCGGRTRYEVPTVRSGQPDCTQVNDMGYSQPKLTVSDIEEDEEDTA